MWQEIGISLSLGLKESLKSRYFLMLLLLWLTLLCVWVGVYFAFATQIAAMVNTLIEQSLAGLNWSLPSFLTTTFWAFGLVTALLLVILAVFISLRILIELILMPVLQRAILPAYPHLSNHYASPALFKTLWFLVGHYAQFFALAVLSLFVPFIGAFLLLWISAYYTSTALVRDALDGVANFDSQTQFIRREKWPLTFIGLACLCLTFIPFIGLFAPLILGASITHFCLRNVFTPEQQAQFHQGKIAV